MHRLAYTLIEIVIAGALFFTAMAVVVESVVATRHLNSHGAAKDQIELDANSVIRTMSADIALSGWEFGEATDTFAGVPQATDRTLRYYPMVLIQRSPSGGNTLGFNTAMPWTSLDASLLTLPALPTVLTGTAADAETVPLTDAQWERSFRARSSHLVFLRATVGSWPTGQAPGSTGDESLLRHVDAAQYLQMPPSYAQPPRLNFTLDSSGRETNWQDWRTADQHDRLQVLFTTGFLEDSPGVWLQRFPDRPYGVTLDGGWYDWTDIESAPIKPTWESMRKPDVSSLPVIGGMSANDVRRAYAIAPERWREFMYAVVPSPTPLGLGRLVRAYRHPGAAAIPVGVEPGQRISVIANDTGLIFNEQVGMVIDKVLSDDVVRVVFDTYRTVDDVATLGINQVRVRLFFARRQITNPDIVVTQVVETTLSMRARSSGADMERIFGTLGSTPIGLSR